MDFRYVPPPPPPPSSLDPHRTPQQQPIPPPPGAWNSGQFQYHSRSPPPPQWGPQPPPPPPPHHYAAGPPPPPHHYSSNPYSLPPRPHMHPPPQPHYPPVNQEWSNTSWGHPGFDYSAHNKNDDDWAARAKAWAASKTVTDDQHQHSQLPPANRPEEINYQDQYSQNVESPYQEFQQHSLPPSNYQQYSSFAPQPRPPANHLQEPASFSSGYATDGHFLYTAGDGNLRDSVAAYPHQETAPTSLSVHQQEVPSSYSSVAGNDGPRDMNGNFYQPSHMSFASASQHQVRPPLSSNDRPISIEQQPQYAFNNSSAEPPADLSNQPLDFGPRYGHDYVPFGQSGLPGMPFSSMPLVHPTGQQADPSVGVPSPASMHSAPFFGSISNTTFPIGTSNSFHGDTYGTPGFLDRPKKASVPNWLREEIIKKAVIGSSAQELSRHDPEFNEDEEVMDRSQGDQVDGKSMKSTRSKEEEDDDDDDDEDDAESARTAAINAEIKRLLTEVLLKVTDELFDEIATKVLDEDELNVEVERKAIASSDTVAAVITPKSSAKVLIPAKTKGIDSPGDVLGLGNYASDDDEEEEKEAQISSIPSSISGKPVVHPAENGSSQKKLPEEERDSHVVSPNRAIGNDNTREEKVKPGSVDFSKSKQSVTEGLNAENSLPDDSQGKIPRNGQDKIHIKVDEKSRVHDEKYAKRTKKEDQNDSKEKIKERDSGKQVSKAEVKDDKKDIDRDRRSREKEESRKRERGKDDKNERSKYKNVGDSIKHKRRHRSPSPVGKRRSSKDRHAHRSSDSSSSDSRRKVRSRRRDSSPSPVRSRRQVSRSRSPPSKHSHRRHSNYSSLETTRERRRSRSRSRRG